MGLSCFKSWKHDSAGNKGDTHTHTDAKLAQALRKTQESVKEKRGQCFSSFFVSAVLHKSEGVFVCR